MAPVPPAAALWLLLALATRSVQAGDFHVPSTVSEEAAAVLREWKASPPLVLPQPEDQEAWRALWAASEVTNLMISARAMEQFQPVVVTRRLGGVPVLDVKPKGWVPSGRLVVHLHGGGYVLGSANSSLAPAASVASDTGLRVISVDYTVAPIAKWEEITNQVLAVMAGLVAEGYGLEQVAVYGDSAGGGLAAGSVLKMRDGGMGMPAAVVLRSPWSDVTDAGDTRVTLLEHDPVLGNVVSFSEGGAAYADPADQMNPCVSPVYGDYSKGFPPTLIQVGTKEALLSDSVRQYQAMDAAGIDVKLDVYEGMWHVFQGTHWNLPESVVALSKMARFLDKHLGCEYSP